MNTKSVIVVTACVISLSCLGQSNVVYYGVNSNALDVVFVDTNLSQKAKSAIVADLRICLQEWGKNSELRLRDNEGFAGYLYNSKTCPHYPEEIEFPDNIVSNGTSGVALQISKDLSDAYTNAFKFAAANTKAFAAANAFVEFVNSPAFLNLPPKDLPNYFLRNDMTPKEIIEDAQELISALRCQTYYPPSVLSFAHTERGPARKSLWVRIPESSPSGNRKEWGYLPAIWHQGKWKFCHWEENPQYNLP